MAIKSIMVAIAGGPASLFTAKYAIVLARLLEVKLFAVYVINERVLHELLKSRIFVEVEARTYERDLEQQGIVFLERIKKMAEDKKIDCETLLLKGVVSDEVINKAQQLQADILVMGELRELKSRAEAFYDEGERIFHRSPCPVLVVKNPTQVENLYREI